MKLVSSAVLTELLWSLPVVKWRTFISVQLVYRKELIPFENAKIVFVDEIFAIEKPGTQLNVNRLTSNDLTVSAQQPLSE